MQPCSGIVLIKKSFLVAQLLAAVFLSIIASSSFAGTLDDGFMSDADAAVAKAKKEGKDIMLLFTGSDWCPPCKKLESEVFSKDEFAAGVSEKFVLVKFDFLRTVEMPPELAAQNTRWSEKYSVDAFPTVVMVDADLKPFAFAGYQEGGAENYVQMMNAAADRRIERDKKLAAAQKVSGAERAKLLDAAIADIGEQIVGVYYQNIVDEIVSLDSDNKLGLRAKWNSAADADMRKVIMTDLLLMSRVAKPDQAIQFIDELMQQIEFTNTEKLTILQVKLSLNRQLKDGAAVDATLEQMIGLDGVTGGAKQRLVAKKAYLMAGDGREKEAITMLDSELANSNEASGSQAGYLYLAKGELLFNDDQSDAAIKSFDAGIAAATQNVDLMTDLIAAKSDALFSQGESADALKILDDFSDNDQFPTELRAEIMLQKSMMMRDLNRVRQARLVENRAIEIASSPAERSAIQKIVENLRSREK
jgi:thioredoxin-related protein